MRYIVIAAALVVLLAILAPSAVLAQDYVKEAAQALQHSFVYVAPDTEGTDNDTAGLLQKRLNKDDNIVLVMLPAAAEVGTDINTIATRLSEELGNQRIIGLAVGNNVVGYAPTLPVGIAADQMRRAKSVSNDPITAISTFAQNVHIWQAKNPQPIQPMPSPLDSPEKGGVPWFVWLGIAAAIVLGITIIVALLGVATRPSTERTHFKAPDHVKDLLAKIAREREQIHDEELKGVLYQMCVDIERYFASSSSDKKRDASFFRERLTEVIEVLGRYIDIQQTPIYYFEPRTELERGKTSITDFSQYVLLSIRRGHATDLLDFKVNTDILRAQLRR